MIQVKLILWLLVVYLIYRCFLERSRETFGIYNSPLIYDHYVPNQNAFRNYYRTGNELSKNLGWKPEMGYEHLRPENNECPECFQDED